MPDNKGCPNCRHACYHLAPTCEECGWDFTADRLPRHRDDRLRVRSPSRTAGKPPTAGHAPSVDRRPESASLQSPAVRAKPFHGDCLRLLEDFAENSIDALVTAPPAGIAFMGKEWDKDRGGKGQWVK